EELTRPALERDRAHCRSVLVANHLSPGPSIRRTNLRRALTHAKQPLAAGRQARNGSPILSTTRSTTHRWSFLVCFHHSDHRPALTPGGRCDTTLPQRKLPRSNHPWNLACVE